MRTSPFRVFVSSTWLDLRPEREALRNILPRLREIQPAGMEDFGSRAETAANASLDEVERADVFVLILGGRYGSGITWREYSHARRCSLPCFVYLKDEATIADSCRDTDPHSTRRLRRCKALVRKRHIVQQFTAPDNLATMVIADLHRWLSDDRGLATRLVEYAKRLATTRDFRNWEQSQYFDLKVGAARSEHGLNMRLKVDAVGAAGQRADGCSMDETIGRYRQLVVVGEPGAGKTTLLKHIAVSYAQRFAEARLRDSRGRGAVLPIYVWLPRFATVFGVTPYLRILSLARDALSQLGMPIDEAQTRLLFERESVILLLDGLNEVGDDNVGLFFDGLESLIAAHSDTLLVITSRAHNYRNLRRGFPVVELLELDYPEGVEQYLCCYLADEFAVSRIMGELQANTALRNLALNPLLLMLTIVVFQRTGEIPGSRGELLREIAQGLLGNWHSGDPRSLVSAEAAVSSNYWIHDKQHALELLGYQMKRLGLELPYARAVDILHSGVKSGIDGVPGDDWQRPSVFAPPGPNTDWNKFVDELVNDRLLVQVKRSGDSAGASTIRFWHQTLQEYFAAAHIWTEVSALFEGPRHGAQLTWRQRRRLEGTLEGYLRTPQWHEIIAIVGGLISRGDDGKTSTTVCRFIDHVWRTDRLLAAMCASNTRAFDAGRLDRYVRWFRRRIYWWGVIVPRACPWLLLTLLCAIILALPLQMLDPLLVQAASNAGLQSPARDIVKLVLVFTVGSLGLFAYLWSWALVIERVDRFVNARFVRPGISALRYLRTGAALQLLTELDVRTRNDFSVGTMTRATISAGLLRSPRSQIEVAMMLDGDDTMLEAIERLGEAGGAGALNSLECVLDRRNIDDICYASAVRAAVCLIRVQSVDDLPRRRLEGRLRAALIHEASFARRVAAYRGLQDLGAADVEPPTSRMLTWVLRSGLALVISVGLLAMALAIGLIGLPG